VPALALRRAEAAAALGVSVEVFDDHVRPNVPACRAGGVTIYPVEGLRRWLDAHGEISVDQLAHATRRAA
jgi:hypothetical protein